jgi:hypothetical protein
MSKTGSSLSSEERRKREDAVRFANASMRLSGFIVSPEEQAHSDRFIAGEIDLAEFLQGRGESAGMAAADVSRRAK